MTPVSQSALPVLYSWIRDISVASADRKEALPGLSGPGSASGPRHRTTMSHMVAPRAPRPSRLLLALALLAGVLPAMSAAEAATSPSLQVSREITASGPDIATLTATLTPRSASPVMVNFEVLNG